MILANNAPSIPKQNFTALTRLDYNRFIGQVQFVKYRLPFYSNANLIRLRTWYYGAIILVNSTSMSTTW